MSKEIIPDFEHNGRKLRRAIDALLAYDTGATDSGVSDPALKQAVRDYLKSLPEDQLRVKLGRYARTLLTNEALSLGYGLADVLEFVEWLREQMGIKA